MAHMLNAAFFSMKQHAVKNLRVIIKFKKKIKQGIKAGAHKYLFKL